MNTTISYFNDNAERACDILPPPSLKLRGGGFSVKNTSVSRLPELMGFPLPKGTLIFVVFITEALFSVLLFSGLWLRCDPCHDVPRMQDSPIP